MSSDPRSDHTLMEAVKAGDLAAFDTLYERHHRPLFTFFLRSLRDPREAEDLLQETFLRAFARRRDYQPTAAFRAWLFTIARHLVVDLQRRRSGRLAIDPGETLEALADPGPTPFHRAEGEALGERLERAVAGLSPAQREVLLLSRFAGLRHDEIARVTGASPGAVRVTLHRALHRLRELLGPL